MARIYISSTFKDLVEERAAASMALKELDHWGEGMEAYLAADGRPLDESLKSLGTCDGYIGLIGRRYGYRPDGYDGKSITELEYEEAGRLGLPRLIFFVESRPIAEAEPEVERFRDLLGTTHLIEHAHNLDELRSLVARSVLKEFGMGTQMPPLLPYLCDRSDQLQEFKADFEKSYGVGTGGDGRPLLVIAHGDEREAHSKFIERLRKQIIPKIWRPAQSRNGAVKQYLLPWPAPWRGIPRGRDQLLGALALALNVERAPEAVVAALCRIPGLCVVESHVLTADCRRDGIESLEDFLKFWDSLPFGALPPNLVITLSIKYARTTWDPFRRIARTNAAMRAMTTRMSARLAERLRVTVLSELEGVLQNHADQWAQLEDTQRFCGSRNLEPDIRRIFEDEGDGESIPMEELAKKLSLLLRGGRKSEGAVR